MKAQTLLTVLLPILVKSFPLNKDFVTYETLGFICIPNAKAETKLQQHETHTVLEFPFDAEEGVGYAADLSVDVGILSLAVLEDFVHVEVEDLVDHAAFI